MKNKKSSTILRSKDRDKKHCLHKLLMFACFVLTFFCAYAQTGNINLSVKNASIREVFNTIEKQSSYRFSYRDADISEKIKITANVTGESLKTFLTRELTKNNLTYTVSGNKILVVPVQNSKNQVKKSVIGIVKDVNGDPIIGANVTEKGTTNGIITDMDGKFTLPVPENAVLEISFIGFETEFVKAKSGQQLAVILREGTNALDEVVVVGFGTQKKVNLTGAVQSVSSKDLVRRNVTSSSAALQGMIPGVVVSQSSGAPGATAAIQIRGTGSMNSSSGPLVLIDGVEGDMNSIDLNAIESVSVLKDGASAAIYGAKAANGVILITTKRANNTGVKVSYDGYVGMRSAAAMPEPVDAIGYMTYINHARANQNQDPQYSEETINLYRTQGADNIHRFDTNWKKLMMDENTLTHNHSVSISGGSEKLKSFVNASYSFEDGMLKHNDFTRTAIRSNTDAKLTDWLTASLNLNLRRTVTNEPATGASRLIFRALTLPSVFAAVNSDGTWGNGQNGDNPYAISQVGGSSRSDHNDLDLKGTLLAKPVKGLELMASYASRKYERKTDSFTKTYDTYEAGQHIMTYPTTGNSRGESWYRTIRNQFNAQVSYENTFAKKHYLKALVAFQADEIKNKEFSAGRTNFYYDGYEQLNHGDVATATAGGSRNELSMMSYIARINYAFADRYLLELTGRYDGSSRFTADNRWGFFPSVSVGWRISEEPFFRPLKSTIDNLKLRASFGELGNQEISGYYPYAATLSSGAGYWFNQEYTTGIYASAISNANITWEKSTQYNFGLDALAFNSRLNLSFDYYIRNISDLLQKFPVPQYIGLSAPWQNAGKMRNKGWDLSISWNDKIGNVRYNITGILSDVKNEITDLYGNEYINSNNTTQEGYPIWSWYGYVADGYFQTQEEIDNTPVYGNNPKNVKPGYIKYKDISGPEGTPDGKINDFDRTIIGDPQNRYSFSLNMGAEWNNFDFNVFFQGIGKRDIYFEGAGARPFHVGASILESQLDTWTPENPNAKFPLLLIDTTGSNMNNIPSSFWVKSGAYMRLKNISIGYTLPKKLLQRMKVDNIRFYISGQNLFTLSDAYEGYDPEGDLYSYYPVMKVYTFGVNVRF